MRVQLGQLIHFLFYWHAAQKLINWEENSGITELEWAYKVQSFVGLNEKILNISNAVPYSISDQQLFRESIIPSKLNPETRAVRVEESEESEESEERFK